MCYTLFRMSQVLDSDNSILFSKQDKMTKYCCPICESKVDKEHFSFVLETINDPQKMKDWTDGKWTFETWRKRT